MRLGVDLRCLQDNYLAGVGEYTWQILQTLPQIDPDVKIIGYAKAAGKINLPPNLSTAIKLQRNYLPNRVNNLLSYWQLGQPIDKLISTQTKSIDTLWLPNPGFIHCSGKTRTILTVHDLAFVHWPEFFKWRSRWWYFKAVKKLFKQLPLTNINIACVSQYTADDLIDFVPTINKKRIKVIYPGVGDSYFNKPQITELADFKQRYHLPANYLLSLGTIEPRKNYELLLKAYAEIVKQQADFPCDLVIAGSWGWNTTKLKKIIKYYPHKKRLHILGYVKAEDKRLLYSGANLFLYPSFYEGFGMPPLEAMASGTPVITSQTSSLPEVVAEAGLMLSPYLPSAWVEAIIWLSQDTRAREKFKSAALARAQNFNWPTAARQYLDYFNS